MALRRWARGYTLRCMRIQLTHGTCPARRTHCNIHASPYCILALLPYCNLHMLQSCRKEMVQCAHEHNLASVCHLLSPLVTASRVRVHHTHHYLCNVCAATFAQANLLSPNNGKLCFGLTKTFSFNAPKSQNMKKNKGGIELLSQALS